MNFQMPCNLHELFQEMQAQIQFFFEKQNNFEIS